MINWLKQIHQLFDNGTPFVLATICSIDGTSPESPGAQLIITADCTSGELQSSHRQKIIVKQSREMLTGDSDWYEKTYPLGHVMGAANGHCTVSYNKFITEGVPAWFKQLRVTLREGRAAVLANHIDQVDGDSISSFEVYEFPVNYPVGEVPVRDSSIASKVNELLAQDNQQQQQLHVIGGDNRKTVLQLIQEPDLSIAVVGHSQVALSLINQLLLLPVQIHWISEQFLAGDPNGLKLTRIDLTEAAFQTLGRRTKVAIATSNHELDLWCCYQALNNRNLSYIGCLGSLKKMQIARAQLAGLGVPESRLKDLNMPIGLDSITGKQPAIIAASIVAQLLADPAD